MPTDAQIDAAFTAANDFIKSGEKGIKVDNATKLKYYGLYKQSTEGPCTGKNLSVLMTFETNR